MQVKTPDVMSMLFNIPTTIIYMLQNTAMENILSQHAVTIE